MFHLSRLSLSRMPTYEYRCPDGHEFERFAKMSESAAELSCPVCGKPAARRLSGGAGLVFKGSGFYLTDYGKNAHRKGGGDTVESGAKKSGESGDGPATASDTKSSDTKSSDTKSSESRPSEPKAAESKSGDATQRESKARDSKARDSTSSESKANPSKAGESKPSGSSGSSGQKPEK